MGRAGRALRQTLQTYSISQNKLATAMGVERSAVYKWFHEERDPTSETVVEIVTVLRQLNPEAAQEFVKLYLGNIAEGKSD